MAESSKKVTPRDLLRVAFRRWKMFLLGWAVFSVAVLVASHKMPLKYTAETIFRRRTDASNVEGKSAESFESLKLTLQHELMGYGGVERAVADLGLLKNMHRGSDGQLTREGLMARQELIRELRADLAVRWTVRSENIDQVALSFTHSDPRLAEQLPNVLVHNYIARVYDQIVNRLTGSRDFLQKQVEQCSRRLEELNEQRTEFERKHIDMLPESVAALNERILELNSDMDVLRRQETLSQKKLARHRSMQGVGSQTATQPSQVVYGPNPEYVRLQTALREAEDALAAARRAMTEKHPRIVDLRRQIEDNRARLAETPPETVIQRIYDKNDRPGSELAMRIADAEAEVDQYGKQLQAMQNRLTAYQRILVNFGPIRQRFLEITDKQRKAQDERDEWQKKLNAVQMSLAAEVEKRRTHLETVESARQQFRPSSPKLLMVLGLALAGGAAFAAGLVTLVEMMDRSISKPDDIRRQFGMAVLGIVGEIVTPKEATARRVRRWVLCPLLLVAMLVVVSMVSLSVVLRLQYTDKYRDFIRQPVRFVVREVGRVASR